jgi:hypothetical protein
VDVMMTSEEFTAAIKKLLHASYVLAFTATLTSDSVERQALVEANINVTDVVHELQEHVLTQGKDSD